MTNTPFIDPATWTASAAREPALDPHLFMVTENLDKAAFREALTEYRNLDVTYPSTPWATDELDVLTSDFINWYRWERL